MFIWEQNYNHTLFREILEIVEPHHREREAIMKCLERGLYYRSYLARDKNNSVVAIAIATLLPKTQTLHVEDFALHPIIRKQGHAQKLWDDWRALVRSEWTTVTSMTIEVYLQNVEPWKKIMGVEELIPHPIKLLPLAPNVPMMLMGRDLTSPVNFIFKEWQEMQRDAADILKLNLNLNLNEKVNIISSL